jgi:hypothetical protein
MQDLNNVSTQLALVYLRSLHHFSIPPWNRSDPKDQNPFSDKLFDGA